jgi:hypothetical protein
LTIKSQDDILNTLELNNSVKVLVGELSLNVKMKVRNKMYTENFDNGDIRVTFNTKESYWSFMEVATFKEVPWAVRIWDKEEYHLAADFPGSRKEYYGWSN